MDELDVRQKMKIAPHNDDPLISQLLQGVVPLVTADEVSHNSGPRFAQSVKQNPSFPILSDPVFFIFHESD